MNFLIPKILEFLPDWNKRIHTEEDGENFCERHDIIRVDTDLLDDLGEYKIRDDFPVILTQKFLSSRYRNLVLQHEIGHFILHPTTAAKFSDEVQKTKLEKEANYVAAIALMPLNVIMFMPPGEIQDEYGYPMELIQIRLDICRKEKI